LAHGRARVGPPLLRRRVPRRNGHSSADNQSYKDDATMAEEWERDPLRRLRGLLLDTGWCAREGEARARHVEDDVRAALDRAQAQPEPDPATSCRFMFSEDEGRRTKHENTAIRPSSLAPRPDDAGPRMNMVDAIRRTLEHELAQNPRMLVF